MRQQAEGSRLSNLANVARLVELPPEDRPRERLLRGAAHSLSEAELIALVLRTGSGNRDAVTLARTLLKRFGGLGGVLSQDAKELASVAGLGNAKVAALMAIRELLKRAELDKLKSKPVLSTAAAVRRYVSLRLAHRRREVFGVVLLNTRLHFIAVEDLFFGSVDRASVYPREVIKRALHHNAAAVIFYHNHPSGDPKPSEHDREITERLIKVLDEIDVRVVDHVVVAGFRQASMAELGMIEVAD